MSTYSMATVPVAQNSLPTKLSETARTGIQRLRQCVRPDGERTYSISRSLAPSAEVRASLVRRAGLLVEWHKPAGTSAVAPHIDLMLGTLRMQAEGADDSEARRKAYYMAMSDLPLYAVQTACLEALRGHVGNPKFAPGPGELHAVGERATRAFRQELIDIRQILDARIEDEPVDVEARRAAVARVRLARDAVVKASAMVPLNEMARRLRRDDEDRWDLKARQADDDRLSLYATDEETRASAQQRLEAMAYRDAPASLSPEALSSFGITPKHDKDEAA